MEKRIKDTEKYVLPVTEKRRNSTSFLPVKLIGFNHVPVTDLLSKHSLDFLVPDLFILGNIYVVLYQYVSLSKP